MQGAQNKDNLKSNEHLINDSNVFFGGSRGQTDRGYKKPVTNTDIEIAIPLGMKRIPDSENQYSFRYETDTG